MQSFTAITVEAPPIINIGRRFVILEGGPGAGKDEHGKKKLVSWTKGSHYIGTGDICRRIPDLVQLASSGGLIPDQTILEQVFNEVAKTKGTVILNGCPRTVLQALRICEYSDRERMLSPIVLSLVISKETSQMRCLNRGKQGEERRSDDTLEKWEKRWAVYQTQTVPMLDHLRGRLPQHFHSINSEDSKEEVWLAIQRAIQRSTLLHDHEES